MRVLFKVIDFIITILYFVFVTVGSLLVIPCRLLSVLLFAGTMIILIDIGLNNWRDVVPYWGISILLSLLPSFISVYMGQFLLYIKNRMYM